MKSSTHPYSLEILVRGNVVREYTHNGSVYVEGREGSDFTLNIRNNTGKRVLAVPSVDGLSVLTGKIADYNGIGYIVDAYSSLKIPGWRVSATECAQFLFDKKGSSYASSQGKPANVGVIGCAIFEEKVKDVWPYYIYNSGPCPTPVWPTNDPWAGTTTCLNSNNFTYTSNSINVNEHLPLASHNANHKRSKTVYDSHEAPAQNLGVGFGDAVEHRVVEVEFDKATAHPTCIMTIFYDNREGLINKGVILNECHKVSAPNPFPANSNYCKPPKNWKRK